MSWANAYTVAANRTLNGATNQTNFPALFYASATSLKSTANGGSITSSNCYDFAVYTDTTLTQLAPFEILSWNSTTGTIWFVAQFATLNGSAASSNSSLCVVWGNSAITSPLNTGAYSPANLWGAANYKAVLHLQGITDLTDSTGNGNTATTHGSLTTGTAQIGSGVQSTTTGEYLTCANNLYTILGGVATFSLSFWVTATTLNQQVFVDGAFISTGDSVVEIVETLNNGYLVAEFNGSSGELSSKSKLFTSGTWHLVHVVQNGSGGLIYLDGSPVTTTGTLGSLSNSGQLALMTWSNLSSSLVGTFNEFRATTATLPADWITAEYQNQKSPGNIGSASYMIWTAVSLPVGQPLSGSLSACSGSLATRAAHHVSLSASSATCTGSLTGAAKHVESLSASTAVCSGSLVRVAEHAESLTAATSSWSGSLATQSAHRGVLSASIAAFAGSIGHAAKHAQSLAASTTAYSGSLSSIAKHLLSIGASLSICSGSAYTTQGRTATGTLAGASTEAATGIRIAEPSGALTGASTAASAGVRQAVALGAVTGTSAATLQPSTDVTGALFGTTSASVAPLRITQSAATVASASTLVAAGIGERLAAGVIAGSSTASLQAQTLAAGTLTGTSSVSASASEIEAGIDHASGTSSVVACAQTVAAANGVIAATSALSGTLAITITGIEQDVFGLVAAASTLAAVPNMVFSAVGNLPNGSWYAVNPIRMAVVTDAETDSESSAGASWFIAAVGSVTGASQVSGSAGRVRPVSGNSGVASVTAVTPRVTQTISGAAAGAGYSAADPTRHVTGVLAGSNDLGADTFGYMSAQAEADGASSVQAQGTYCVVGVLAGSSAATLDCQLPMQANVAGLSRAQVEASYLSGMFGAASGTGLLYSALVSATDSSTWLYGYSNAYGSATQIAGTWGSADGRAEMQALAGTCQTGATARTGNWSAVSASITRLGAITGEADGASQADASCNSNIVLTDAACDDTGSSLAADVVYFGSVTCESDGANDCEADTECLFSGAAYEQQANTLAGTMTGLQSAFSAARSFSFARANVAPNIVLASGAFAGCASEAYQDPPIVADLDDLSGMGNMTGYLASTMGATGQVWCLSFAAGKAQRSKPITGAAVGRSVLAA